MADSNKEYIKVLKTADGFMNFLFTGAFKASFTNLQTGKTITENMSGPGEGHHTFRRLYHGGA